MKARITKPDGTIVELEGTPADIAEACGWRAAPTYIPTPFPYNPYPWWVGQPWPSFTTGTLTHEPPPASITITAADFNVSGTNPLTEAQLGAINDRNDRAASERFGKVSS